MIIKKASSYHHQQKNKIKNASLFLIKTGLILKSALGLNIQ
jgi:hypothetical protein